MVVVKGENGERDQCNMKVLNYSSCNGRLHVYGAKWFSPRWPNDKSQILVIKHVL